MSRDICPVFKSRFSTIPKPSRLQRFAVDVYVLFVHIIGIRFCTPTSEGNRSSSASPPLPPSSIGRSLEYRRRDAGREGCERPRVFWFARLTQIRGGCDGDGDGLN